MTFSALTSEAKYLKIKLTTRNGEISKQGKWLNGPWFTVFELQIRAIVWQRHVKRADREIFYLEKKKEERCAQFWISTSKYKKTDVYSRLKSFGWKYSSHSLFFFSKLMRFYERRKIHGKVKLNTNAVKSNIWKNTPRWIIENRLRKTTARRKFIQIQTDVTLLELTWFEKLWT